MQSCTMRLAATVRHAAFEYGFLGCTSIARTAGLLALEAALSAASGFRWLDQDNGWFTLGTPTSAQPRIA